MPGFRITFETLLGISSQCGIDICCKGFIPIVRQVCQERRKVVSGMRQINKQHSSDKRCRFRLGDDVYHSHVNFSPWSMFVIAVSTILLYTLN